MFRENSMGSRLLKIAKCREARETQREEKPKTRFFARLWVLSLGGQTKPSCSDSSRIGESLPMEKDHQFLAWKVLL